MPEYIDRRALNKEMVWSEDRHELVVPLSVIKRQPILVKEERKGHWERINILHTMFSLFRCSACGCTNEYTSFCPTCGADMDVGRRIK